MMMILMMMVIYPLHTEIYINCVQKFLSYLSRNKIRVSFENQSVNFF
jgi:hypothetical protein